MMSVCDVTKTFYYAFYHVDVLRGVSFEVTEGETLGIIGQNGAGKTTLMKMLLGFLRPTSGSVLVMDARPDEVAVKQHIGFLPENCLLYRYLTGKEFLVFCGELCGLGGKELLESIGVLSERLGMTEALGRRVGMYSKGMQQRLGLIQALLHQPKILFLDEPMSGLDPIGRALFMELLLEEKKKGTTIILNSHVLSDLERLCDRVLLLHQGKVIGHESLDTFPGSLEAYFIDTIAHYDRS